jgi:hypothetical protein
MPLPLPDLDNRRFDDLVGDLRALIPQLAPDWTNHNIADPGITLVELMAWVAEVSLYRANRIPDRTLVNFASLLLGESSVQSDRIKRAMSGVTTADIERAATQVSPEIDQVFVRYAAQEDRVSVALVLRAGAAQPADIVAAARHRLGSLWLSGPRIGVDTLAATTQRALRFFNDPYRAVTPADFEREALRASAAVRRVSVACFPASGTVTVAVLPAEGSIPDAPLLAAVKQRLDDRRLVGTRVVVRPPQYTDVRLQINLAVRPNTVAQAVLDAAAAAVTEFFHPQRGGSGRDGWPFGRPVSVYELHRLVGTVPGVDHVDRIKINDDPDRRELPVEDLPLLTSLAVNAVDAS